MVDGQKRANLSTNQVGICWTILTTVLFVFPPENPVTPDNMNYAIVAFGVMLLIAVSTWIFDGRKHYAGPALDLEGLRQGEVRGMDGEPVGPTTSAPTEEPGLTKEQVANGV